MPKHSKTDGKQHAHERRASDLYVHWQAMRRNDGYRAAVRICLQEVGRLREQWEEKMARLSPPVPEGIPPWVERFEWSAGDFLLESWTWNDWPLPQTGGECLNVLRIVTNYLSRRKQWEDTQQEHTSHINACSLVLDTATQLDLWLTTELCRMPYDVREGNREVPFDLLGAGLYQRLSTCCSAAAQELVPPLRYFVSEWKILFPLNPDFPMPPTPVRLGSELGYTLCHGGYVERS